MRLAFLVCRVACSGGFILGWNVACSPEMLLILSTLWTILGATNFLHVTLFRIYVRGWRFLASMLLSLPWERRLLTFLPR
jgi:hypothetical protein